MPMEITFPGGAAVNASVRGFTIHTDQPEEDGGGNSAPAPFEFFLSSIGTCAGYYALRFCQQRQLSVEGLKLHLDWERDPDSRRLTRVMLTFELPADFPEKYGKAILRAAGQCSVKRAILDPPEFDMRIA
ncbi:OsmC family protein [Desulfuromonas sp. KJ2020]|uniref:OsmC family protein n=1 Tax=Desulfuromonas sp. KJ2020 TaxID=2919173 RepID=UPI0020A735C3|nr:OsmC family protein [Desulfuromonas sp. KJ2020]MCP3176666.1 OsmC family protein [Desulfuromonas sp. KJ2020]